MVWKLLRFAIFFNIAKIFAKAVFKFCASFFYKYLLAYIGYRIFSQSMTLAEMYVNQSLMLMDDRFGLRYVV